MQSNGIAASWSLARQGGTLKVSYTVENQTGDRIYVCDRLVRGAPSSTYEAFEALTVGNYKKTDALLLMLGTPIKRGAVRILPNTYVAVEPGKTHSGTREVPIPFVAFNAYGRANPLSGQPTEAYLMIFTFRGEPPAWKELPGAGGNAIRVPEGQQLEPLTLGPEPIPK